MINVYIVGSKGIPARYGGFETFVENLTKRRTNSGIRYFVSCMGPKSEFTYNNSTCFSLPTPVPGPIGRILHVSNALSWVQKRILSDPSHDQNLVYILGCRIGPLLKKHVKKLHKLNAVVICNPDGLEWKRGKWNSFEKRILKYCEKELVLNSDYIVCDSLGIKDYLEKEYPGLHKAKITYIAYGCDLAVSKCPENVFHGWLDKNQISPQGYFLVVGRFVPENNLFLIIQEFLKSPTKKDLVIVTNVKKDRYYKRLLRKLHFDCDHRIKFVGTVYDENLLLSIRENAFAYIHGHSVGGTNPSLLEALGHTKINILFDVPFNREVGEDQVLYFSAEEGSLAAAISLSENTKISFESRKIIQKRFSWDFIVSSYQSFFSNLATGDCKGKI